MATTTKSPKKKATKKPVTNSKKSAVKVSTKTSVSKKITTKPAEAKKLVTSKKIESSKKPATLADKFKKLNKWNWVMASLHAVQGIVVLVLSTNSLFPVSTSFITVDSIAGTEEAPVLVSATRHLFDINLAYIVAAFFFMSAIAHLYIATVYRKKYESNLSKGINKVRWYEYGISASTMMLGISMLAGVEDLSTLILIFGGTLVMNLCGLVMEVHNQTTTKTSWVSYVVGTIAGLGPWLVIGLYFWGSNQYGEGNIPTFVYYIYASMFVFFSSFALNMYLQYKKKGKWADYLYGEKAYMVLSLVAKSALAWQVFAGTLRP